jgi:hypothetical protein
MFSPRYSNTLLWLLSAATCAAGCAADIDDVGPAEETLERACANASPDATLEPDRGFAELTSPRRYGQRGCYKGYVADAGEARELIITGGDDFTDSQESCESAWIGSYLFGNDGSGWTMLDFGSANGTWYPILDEGGPGRLPRVIGWGCDLGVSFHERNGLHMDGWEYRIAASARSRQSSSAPTSPLTITARY